MVAGGNFNNVYKEFGNNNEDVIILVIDIDSNDDSATVVNRYKTSSQVTPIFPIVLTTGNSGGLESLFGQENTGGPTFIMHPDREFDETEYTESAMKKNLQSALEDDCDQGTTKYTLTVTKGSGSGDYTESEVVSVESDAPQTGYVFEAWIGDTQYLSSTSNSSAKITMPAKSISIEATFRDTSSGDIDTTNPVSIMRMAGWGGGEDTLGSSIDLDTSKLKDEKLIKADLDLTKSDEDKEEWAWVKLTAYLENSFKGVTAYKVRYKADEKVSFVLDQDNLSQAGTSYLCTLSATGDDFKTVLLTEKDFKQPSWHKEKDDLDLEKVKSLSFAAVKEETTFELELSEVILYNYIGESVISGSTNMGLHFNVTTIGGKMAISVPEDGQYRISIHGTDGRILQSESLHLTTGINTLHKINSTSTAVRLITVKGEGKVASFKSFLK